MNVRRFAVVLALALSVVATPAANAQTDPTAVEPTVTVRSDPQYGEMLVDSRGMSLYLYTLDAAAESNCYDSCAIAWPPLLAEAPTAPEPLTADLGTTLRADGTHQVTYKGMPLYYWIADQKPGDITGQNVDGVWFVVAP